MDTWVAAIVREHALILVRLFSAAKVPEDISKPFFAEIFEPFLRAYIEKFKFKSITTSDWKTFLYEFFNDKVGKVIYVMYVCTNTQFSYLLL